MVAPDGSRLGDRAHLGKMAFVLATKTLERFGVESVEELRAVLETFCGSHLPYWKDVRTEESIEKAVPSLRDGYEVIPHADLTKHDRAALSALREMARHVFYAMRSAHVLEREAMDRDIRIGVSDTAMAWTDGSSMIVFDRGTCDLMKRGIGGFNALANVLVHEYLHENSDIGSHQHDAYFYERYHEMTCGEGGILDQAVYRGMKSWLNALKANGVKAPAEFSKNLDIVETLESSALQAA